VGVQVPAAEVVKLPIVIVLFELVKPKSTAVKLPFVELRPPLIVIVSVAEVEVMSKL